MKKIIILFIVFVMAFNLAACSNGGNDKSQVSPKATPTATPEPPKEIALTRENIEEYLAFNFDYSKVKRETKIGISFGYTDLTTNVYSTASGSFNNVKIAMKIYLSNGWSVASSDEAYNENDSEVLTLDFRLPANGSFTETHDLIAAMAYSDPNAQHIIYTITSVSGTFIPQ